MLILIMLFWVLLAGFAGGILRGVLGIAKDLVTKKDATINWLWFGVTVLIAGILGVITASFFSDDLRIATLGGYSGSDLIDGIFKLKINELFKPKNPATENPESRSELGPEPSPEQAKRVEGKTGNFSDLIK